MILKSMTSKVINVNDTGAFYTRFAESIQSLLIVISYHALRLFV